jgi:peptidoglycan/LPS O-acetylase OafA/YrhL
VVAVWGLGMLALASLGWSILQVSQAPMAAFFLLPSRAWELLVGALLAMVPPSRRSWTACSREVVSMLGLGAILICYIGYDRGMPFPGLTALPPVLGAVAFIAANQRTEPGHPPTWSGRFMARRPVVFVGLISYSLYLWHWPVLAFVQYWSFAPLGKGGKLLLVLLSLLLGAVSWWLVERPFRRKRLMAGRRSILAFSAATAALLFACGAGVWCLDGVPARMPAPIGRNGSVSWVRRWRR